MKKKKILTTLAVISTVVGSSAAHHSTPTYSNGNKVGKNNNIEDITLLASQNKIGIVANTSFLHFRSGPTTNDSIIKTLNSNQKMIILGTSGDWYKVNINGTIGYVYSSYVDIQNQTVSSNDNVATTLGSGQLINTTFLHLRDSNSIYSDIIETLNTSSNIKVLAKDGNWFKVQVGNSIGYVYSYYIKLSPTTNIVAPPTTHSNNTSQIKSTSNSTFLGTGHLINTTFLHFRTEANLECNIISTLNTSSNIKVIKRLGSWFEVEVNGQTGYVYSYYVSVSTPKVKTTPITPKPKTPSVTTKGIGTGSLINTTFLHLRDSSSTNSNIIETIYSNDSITVLSKNGAWYKVDVNDQIGYVYAYYLNVDYNKAISNKPITPVVTPNSDLVVGEVVNSSFLHVRSGAGTNFSILEDIYLGNKVEVIKKIGSWYEIKINGKIGYVYDYYLNVISGNLNKSSNSNNPKPISKTEKGKVVNVNSLNIRSTPSTNSKILGTINLNDTVSIISADDGWFKINFNGSTAYVSANYITLTSGYSNDSASTANNIINLNTKGFINTYVANIISSPTNNSDIIGQETIKSPVMITGEKNNYYQIKLGTNYGFILKSFVTLNPTSTNIINTKNNDDSKKDTEVTAKKITTSYPITLENYVNLEYTHWPLFTKQEFLNAIDPSHINNMFEFLSINQFRSVNIEKLNTLLNGKGVLSGQGQAFINACKQYNIDPLYFVNQSILETGYGRSKLAKGITISEVAIKSEPKYNPQGQLVGYAMKKLPKPVTVYNLFGIGAENNSVVFPDRALILGTTYAYTHGWTSLASSISGAADFVSAGYIHNGYYSQNTVYKLRFSPRISSIWHQYSTNVWYSKELANLMKQNADIYSKADNFTYDLPQFKI